MSAHGTRHVCSTHALLYGVSWYGGEAICTVEPCAGRVCAVVPSCVCRPQSYAHKLPPLDVSSHTVPAASVVMQRAAAHMARAHGHRAGQDSTGLSARDGSCKVTPSNAEKPSQQFTQPCSSQQDGSTAYHKAVGAHRWFDCVACVWR